MILTLNGTATRLPDGTTVAALLAERAGSTRGSAVVVDGEIVPRSTWPEHQLSDGVTVEIVTAVQGG